MSVLRLLCQGHDCVTLVKCMSWQRVRAQLPGDTRHVRIHAFSRGACCAPKVWASRIGLSTNSTHLSADKATIVSALFDRHRRHREKSRWSAEPRRLPAAVCAAVRNTDASNRGTNRVSSSDRPCAYVTPRGDDARGAEHVKRRGGSAGKPLESSAETAAPAARCASSIYASLTTRTPFSS